MASLVFSAYNGPMLTTTAPGSITTGTAIKTLQQLATPATAGLEVIEWGISFDGSAAATPGKVELVDTVAIGANVTSYAAVDITKVSQVGTRNSYITITANTSGYTGSAEGSTVASRQFDTQLLPPTAPYIKQFPLERGPVMLLSEFLRVRVHFAAAINALCYIVWAE